MWVDTSWAALSYLNERGHGEQSRCASSPSARCEVLGVMQTDLSGLFKHYRDKVRQDNGYLLNDPLLNPAGHADNQRESQAGRSREEDHPIIRRRGQYDTIFILEAPNNEAVGKMALAIGSQGNVPASTHRLFSEEEFKRIIAG